MKNSDKVKMEEYGNLSETNEKVEELNISYQTEIVKESVPVMTVFIIMDILLFIIGVCGNSLVVYAVVRHKAMQSITNVFVANLAVSDLIICLIEIPVRNLRYLMDVDSIFGDCNIWPIILNVCVYVSTLTLTAIAVVRFFVVIYPFRPKLKLCGCLVIIAATWIISAAISSPLAFHFCTAITLTYQILQCYTVANLVLQYVVPCSIMTYCYSNIFVALKARSEAISGIVSREREETEIRRMKRTNKLLIALITIFVCCWLPKNLFELAIAYHEAFFQIPYISLIFLIFRIIALSSTIWNPFIYALMNDKITQKILSCFVCRRDRD